MKKVSKGMLMTALICGTFVPVLYGGASVYAAEAEAEDALNSFTLDPMIVTAQRVETKDLDTPASVEIFDEERIEKSGAANAFDVLQNTLGVFTQSQGFNGTSMGTMTSKVAIRGVEKGTLVLVNGVPMNLDGKYHLDDIPTESIERIEVVRGGGSVLYGSEATGGVINIITKKKFKNKVSVAAGNFGKERYNLSFGAGKFNISAGLENRGAASPMSGLSTTATTPAAVKKANVYDYAKGERKSVLWNYEITDGLTFTHAYSKNENRYKQKKYVTGVATQYNDYEDTDNNFFLNYDKNGWKATLSYGTQEKDYHQTKLDTGVKSRYSWRKGHKTDANVQKQFDLGKNKLLVGISFNREDMDTYSGSNDRDMDLERNMFSVYASYNWALGKKSNLLFNARETWATGFKGHQLDRKTGTRVSTNNDNLSKFTPEIEYICRINENSSFYAKAGKSFRVPNLTQFYGSGLIAANLDLKPEQGTHFEIGYKLNTGKSSWRLSAFNYKIKDSIEAKITGYDIDGTIAGVDYHNSDVRNTGVELSVNMNHNDNWTTSWGVMFNNPQARNFEDYGDNGWHDYYGKYQLMGSINYRKGKFTGSLDGNFVGDRTRQNNAQPSHLKPQFFTNLHLTYKPESNHKFFFHLNNIFDRLDITSNSSANYYSLGRNFMAGYEFSF